MGILENIKSHLNINNRNAVLKPEDQTLHFFDQMKDVDAEIFVVEPEPNVIYAYTTYLGKLEGKDSAKHAMLESLMQRSADKATAAYALTEDKDIIVKGGFQASADIEEAIVQFNGMWFEMRDLIECLPDDVLQLNQWGLRSKKYY